MNVSAILFWIVMGCVAFGGALGMLGVWVDDFWNYKIARKLGETDAVICITAIVIGLVNWLLSDWLK